MTAEPHGHFLVDRRLPAEAVPDHARQAAGLPRLPLDPWSRADLVFLANGGYSPLVGFMTRHQYRSCVEEEQLPDGLPWALPVSLHVDAATAVHLALGATVALGDPQAGPWAILQVEDVFATDLAADARALFGTDDPAHPGVARWLSRGPWLVGGPVWLLVGPAAEHPGYDLPPAATRAVLDRWGLATVAAWVSPGVPHRGHEYLQKCVLESLDGLLVHVQEAPGRDQALPLHVRLAAHRLVADRYFPADRTLVAAYLGPGRLAGPREVLHEAIVHKNYGCTHYLTGLPDPVVARYYSPADVRAALARWPAHRLGVRVLVFETPFYCRGCGALATSRTCPHPTGQHLAPDGPAVRTALRRGQAPAADLLRPEVAALLLGSPTSAPPA